ncbi:uncharacterized protein V6R79_012568 [Siganus canaliculatus]
MRSPRLRAALGLLLRLLLLLTASAARHGCLFEKKLCPRDQLCSDDGLFGQCHVPRQEPVQYQVSVQVLHKLQEVLKDLMVQGLTWRDDLTQEIISRELAHVPTVDSSKPSRQSSRLLGSGQRRPQGPEDPADPEVAQQYLDYMVLDPSRSSVHMQMPLLDPYAYHKQPFGLQEEEERSLNSLDQIPARSRSRGGPLDRDRQLLQDLVALYLTSPSSPSSSSSSSPVQSLSRHRGAAGFPPSASSFFPELDFPLDYNEDYISQMAKLSEQKKKKEDQVPVQDQDQEQEQEQDTLSGLDERSLQRLALLLDHYGLDLDLQHLSPEQRDQLQLDASYGLQPARGEAGAGAAARKKVAESSMAYKAAPPSTVQPEEAQKAAAAAAANQDAGKKSEPAANGKEFGFIVTNQSVVGPAVTFRIRPNSQNLTAGDAAAEAGQKLLEAETGLKVLQGAVGERNDVKALPLATRVQPGSRWVFAALVAVACIGSILVAAMTIACLRHHAHRLAAKKLGLGPEGGGFSHQEYQHMASKGAFGRMEAAALGAVGGASGGGGAAAGGGGGDSRVSSVSSQFSDGAQPSPSSHSSTPSWCEEPAQANMDISTGHMILAYMEDHLRNKDRLLKEWEALCSYQAEPSAVSVAQRDANVKKNRCPDAVPYDHSRVKLKADINPSRADYINASTIIEHDPRMPAYIATQGPLSHTISDFWQMVWENGCTVIVMMTALVEDGEKQCDRYWPDEGSSLYHIYEVNLVSEHIWCNDFLVRSFYLKNVQTQETRTLTQFHFLSWPAQGIPTSTRPLLDFRRKVNKCYRGRSCPIIVHCSDGTGRTGTYILIDMVLNRMAKGVKEIDIAATLEHVRDQRPGMVRTKDQFEFALTAVAEEVNAILKALPQ